MSDSFFSEFNGIGGGGGGGSPSCCFIVQCGTGTNSTLRICSSNTASGNYSNTFGKCNTTSANCASINGGFFNVINSSSTGSIIAGGTINEISNSTTSFIGGGSTNLISANSFANGASIVGGYLNKICGLGGNCCGQQPFIGSGTGNVICLENYPNCCTFTYDGNHFLGGGSLNIVGTFSSYYDNSYPNIVVGGYGNCAIGYSSSVVVGGYCNVAPDCGYNFIGGGCCNLAFYLGSIVGGNCNSAIGFIGAGSCNLISSNTFRSAIVTGDTNSIMSPYDNFIGAGSYNNLQSAKDSTIVNGCFNNLDTFGAVAPNLFIASGFRNNLCGNAPSNTIINGNFNFSNSQFGIIGGGINNVTCCLFNDCNAFATIVNGVGNNTTGGTFSLANCCFTTLPTRCNAGQYSFIGNGFQNRATGLHSSVLSGQNNTASNNFSVILGGCNNVNARDCSFIAGNSITADRCCTLLVNNLSIKSIPTASTGLPSGAVWRCTTDNILRIIP